MGKRVAVGLGLQAGAWPAIAIDDSLVELPKGIDQPMLLLLDHLNIPSPGEYRQLAWGWSLCYDGYPNAMLTPWGTLYQ